MKGIARAVLLTPLVVTAAQTQNIKTFYWKTETVTRNAKPAAGTPAVFKSIQTYIFAPGKQREDLWSPDAQTGVLRTSEKVVYWDLKVKEGFSQPPTREDKSRMDLTSFTRYLAQPTSTKGMKRIHEAMVAGQKCNVLEGPAPIGKGRVVLHIVAEGPVKGLVLQSSHTLPHAKTEMKTLKLLVNSALPADAFKLPSGIKFKSVRPTIRKVPGVKKK